jgi:PEGA domain
MVARLTPVLGLAVVLALPLLGCGGAPPKEPETPASTPGADAPDEPKGDDSATLDVTCLPPAEVKVDGKSVGKSPLNTKVTAGPHDVTCVDPQSGPSTMAVTLAAGEGRSVSLGNSMRVAHEPPAGKSDSAPKK